MRGAGIKTALGRVFWKDLKRRNFKCVTWKLNSFTIIFEVNKKERSAKRTIFY